MKEVWAILIGILVIFGVSQVAKAGELEEIVKDKQVVYAGSCLIDKKANLTFEVEKAVGEFRCVVGVQEGNTDQFWVLFYSGDKPYRLILFTKSTGAQVTLWMNAQAGV